MRAKVRKSIHITASECIKKQKKADVASASLHFLTNFFTTYGYYSLIVL